MARVRQRPQRIARYREVARQPQQRRRGRKQRQPRELAAGRARRPAADQIQPVEARERPRLGSQQPGEREQPEHGRACPPPARLHEQGAEHEQQVEDVDVGAHAVGEDRHAREQDERRHRPRSAAEPLRSQLVHEPAASRHGEEAERDRHLFRRARPQRREHHAQHLQQRMRSGGDRDVVGGCLPAGQLAAPRQPVERVVVGKAHAADQSQRQRARAHRQHAAERHALARAGCQGPKTHPRRGPEALHRRCHERPRYPLAPPRAGRDRG